jgi:hypothetical protein
VQGGTGTDTVVVQGTSAAETITVTATGFSSGATNVTFSSGVEHVTVDADAGGDTVTVQGQPGAAPVVVLNSEGPDTVNVNTDNTDTAAVEFGSTMDLAALNIGAGGLATMTANGNRLLATGALSVNPAGKLDLFDNDLLVDYTGPSVYTAVRALISSARNGGAWDGNGVGSTTAGANPNDNTTLGILEASEYDSIYGAGALFDGVDPDGTAVLVKYTYYGDTDFTGQVDFDDYVRTDGGYNNNRSGWLNGDLDGNGSVDFDDYVLIDLGFNSQGAAL